MNFKVVCVIFVFFVCIGLNCFGQSTEVDLNVKVPSNTPAVDNAYRINGVSTAEDIGGVEVSIGRRTAQGAYGSDYKLVFENYNNFTVTVIFEVEILETGNIKEKRTGTIVLRANEKKETSDSYYRTQQFVLIVRRLSS